MRELKIAADIGKRGGNYLKDTSGPSINILIKLSAIFSFIFSGFFKNINLFGPKVWV